MSADSNHASKHRLAACRRAFYASYTRFNTLSHHVLGAVCKLLLLAYFIFCALFLTLRYVVLPHIDNYKGAIEHLASRAIGNTVTVATIDASWDGLRPRLSLNDVVIHDRSGADALTLPLVTASISWESLLVGDLRFHTLTIDRPDLSILRTADGRMFVAGIEIKQDKGHNGGLAWALAQREVVIRQGRLRWEDRKRGATQLSLDDVNLVLRNNWRHHLFALKATPPAALAGPIDVRADFRHAVFSSDIADVKQWSGVLYADLRDTDLAAWKAYVDFPFTVERGVGSLRAWLTLDRARVADFTADLRLTGVSAQLGPGLQPLQLAGVAGRIVGAEPRGAIGTDGMPAFGAGGHRISLRNFSLTTSDGQVLPPTSIDETFVPARGSRAEAFSIDAQLLDLKILSDLAGRLPLSGPQRQMLGDLSPRGRLHGFSAQWQGTYPDIESYRIKGAFEGLGLRAQPPHLARPKTGNAPSQAARAAVPGIPGFDNLSGDVDLTEKGGMLKLASQKLTFQLPGYFSDPALPFDSLDLQASWSFAQQDTLALRIQHMDFARPGLAGSLSGTHLWPMRGDRPGVSDLTGKITRFDLGTLDRYLPLQTPPDLRRWLTGALLQGRISDGDVRLQGDLARFPFTGGTAAEKATEQFRVSGKFDNLTMNYTPGHVGRDGKSPEWPLLEQGKGSVLLDRDSLTVHADSARTLDVPLSDVHATVSDLYSKDDALLQITGAASGPMQKMLNYVEISHVTDWIDHFTEETTAAGDGRLHLKLYLPLHHIVDAKVEGSLQFLNNDVVLQNDIPPVSRASGILGFTEKGLGLTDIKGQFLGEPVSIAGGTQADKSTLVTLDGGASAEGLRRAYPMEEVRPLLDKVSGSTRFKASVLVKNHYPKITVESSLQGIGIALPAPIGKQPADALPLKFEMLPASSDQPNVVRDEIRASVGSVIDARYLREKSTERHAASRVISGGIGINQAAVMPAGGLLMGINAKSLDIDAWSQLLNNVGGSAQTSAINSGLAQYLQPNSLAVRADELTVMRRTLNNVVLGASHTGKAWQLNLDSTEASGYLTWNESPTGLTQGKVTARLTKLNIPQSAAGSVGELLGAEDSATQIPALDIVADDFHLMGKSLGRLELVADNVPALAGREWRISKLSLGNPDAELKASGNWIVQGKDNTSHLTYALDIHDAGKLLDRFGFAGAVRGGEGRLDGDITWNGTPFALDIPSLTGQIHLDLNAGQFLKVDPGAAKLLGVLNLQALPRRLTLDFRDVFSEGFAFDHLFGSADIAGGIASTDNLKMTGVAATVLMSGQADAAKETQQLNVVVIPEVNLGTASLVAMAINPVVGVGTFLAQLFLRNPLMRQLTFEYQVAGSWADPVVTKLDRRAIEDNKANGGVPKTE
ncbi:MAG: hypothetical protein JWP38_342 [Herbaspirillum sp.]|nr:hypothetical protein [Herbaspirillum sp.]